MIFYVHEKNIMLGIVQKFADVKRADPRLRVISFAEFRRMLDQRENKFLSRFLRLNPRVYGFRGERYGFLREPKELVTIKKESAPNSGAVITRGVHYLPSGVYSAYRAMNRAMLRNIDRRVFIESGYRSSAYQLILFLEYLVEDDFYIRKTFKRIAFPGYSEHGAPHTQAIDFITADRENNSTHDPIFEQTKEYHWLCVHAREYGFSLSYPRGNKWGVAFEPWHWHYNASII